MRWYAHSSPRLSNATSLKLAYGWPMKDDNDILIEMIKEAFYLAGIALQPGRWAVDSWPICECHSPFSPYTSSHRFPTTTEF